MGTPTRVSALTPLPIPPPQGGGGRGGVGVGSSATAQFAPPLLLLAALAGGAILIRQIEASLPAPLDPAKIPTSTIVVDKDGKLLRPFTTADGIWRLPVGKAQVDPRFLKMLIGYEDRRFSEHDGVDYRALARAAGQFVLAGGHVVSGGSTLTMQVARLIEGNATKDPLAKLRQILLARSLEATLGKDEILTAYLMLAPYGGNIEGVRAASLAYFGKEPTRLTVAEAALLVALPQSPEARRPDHDPAAARAARDRVLDRLAGAGVIDADTAAAAKTERVPAGRQPFPMLAASPRRGSGRRQAGPVASTGSPSTATCSRRSKHWPGVAPPSSDRNSPSPSSSPIIGAATSSPRSDRPACSRTTAPDIST